jgi:hypothetical protein
VSAFTVIEVQSMVIQLTPQLQAALADQAKQLGVTPEKLALEALSERFLPEVADGTPQAEAIPPKLSPLVPQDEWERRLLGAAIDCGFSPPREWLSSENYYD